MKNAFNKFNSAHRLPIFILFSLIVILITLPYAFYSEFVQEDNYSINDNIYRVSIGVGVFLLLTYVFLFKVLPKKTTEEDKSFFRSFKEQLTAFIVIAICTVPFLVFPFIYQNRVEDSMSQKEIDAEISIYNNGRYYFMDEQDNYKYFFSDEELYHYLTLSSQVFIPINYVNKIDDRPHPKAAYYDSAIAPRVEKYFNELQEKGMDSKSRSSNGPKLYLVGKNYFNDEEQDDYISHSLDSLQLKSWLSNASLQLQPKTDPERLKEIQNFISVFQKRTKDDDNVLYFDSPEEVLKKYKSNQFSHVVHNTTAESRQINVSGQDAAIESSVYFEPNRIQRAHKVVFYSKEDICDKLFGRELIALHLIIALGVIMFIFANVELKTSLYFVARLIALFSLLAFLTKADKAIPLFLLSFLYLIGLLFVFDNRNPSLLKTHFVILANLITPYLFFFIFQILYVFLEVGKMDPKLSDNNFEAYQNQHYFMMIIGQVCLFVGVLLYVVLGSGIFKKAYGQPKIEN